MNVVERVGQRYVFLSGGDFHHEIAFQRLGPNALEANPRSVGLFHVAFEVPDRQSFARAYRAPTRDGIAVAAVDHRISWAMYFNVPDGNGLEIYWDTRDQPDGAPYWEGLNRGLTDEHIFEG